MYNAAVEVAMRTVSDDAVDELMNALAPYAVAVGTSVRGWVELRISVPAESLGQATIVAAWLIEHEPGVEPIACEVMLESEFDHREGFGTGAGLGWA